jgi:glucose-6-phosphate-specific signal transduction histidine kinase
MFKKNMGRLDRTLRFIVGVILVPIALFALGGWQGNLLGVLAAAFALWLLATSLTGFCPGYIPFGISTLDREQHLTKLP